MPLYQFEDKSPIIEDPEKYWVAPEASVIGSVTLEEDTSVWFTAVLRGDNEMITIKKGSNVQEGVVMHTDMGFPLVVGEGCTIGHQAMLHGCTLEENVLIGMGATILNGAVIGKNSLVGAHTLVAENKTFPEGVLILGTPAKVIRDLTAEEIERQKGSALSYIEKSRRFKSSLKPLS